jgi:hypothetical protein
MRHRLHAERKKTKMTILDPISGNRVTISAPGKPRGQAAESGLDMRHAVLPGAVDTKTDRQEPNLARNRASCPSVSGNSAS